MGNFVSYHPVTLQQFAKRLDALRDIRTFYLYVAEHDKVFLFASVRLEDGTPRRQA
ncbi:hypothetical protein LMG24235_02699 [Paraburkholderia sabiae]|nr:hypothetical protein LMG24235_02699 [Paraburkholderia sabiae]